MLEIISIVLLIVISIALKIVFEVKFKRLNELSKESVLDELTKRLPDNLEIGKQMLSMLGNSNTKISTSLDEKNKTSLYIVLGNKIIIANNNKSFARVQTIAHECMHSIQSKKLLWFNYIFSNLYIVYVVAITILTIINRISNTNFQMFIICLAGLMFFSVRSYLENDAMTKSYFFAKEYLERTNKLSKEEVNRLLEGYKEINKSAIPATNYILVLNVIGKLLVYCIATII